ncbi:hypothetical protein J7E49_21520 [Variovorax paradoxus]|nr:hypothetical protein [Variovorax paradoxus]
MNSSLFLPILPALAEGSPRILSVEASEPRPAQPGSGLPEAQAGEGDSEVAARAGGAPRGPKREHADAAPGPNLQPMRSGLPLTPIEACQELMLAIAAQGLADDDLAYVVSPTFIHHLLYVGLDPDVALRIKIMYLRGEIDGRRLRTALYC